MFHLLFISFFFFFNDTATTEIYTLSLHDALPIWCHCRSSNRGATATTRAWEPCCGWWNICCCGATTPSDREWPAPDRKSTRLNSSHQIISYAVFCLKKKKVTEPYRVSAHTRRVSR